MYSNSLSYFTNFNKDFTQSYKVIKLGGTSQCKIGYDNLIKIFNSCKENKSDINHIIILSALSGTTNLLCKFVESKDKKFITRILDNHYKLLIELKIELDMIKDIIGYFNIIIEKYISESEYNDIYLKSEIIGFGEKLSTYIFSLYLNINNIDAKLLNSYEYVKSKKEIYQCNEPTEFYINKTFLDDISKNKNYIYILQGFIASTPDNNKILLGRGGSDTTGSLFANFLNAIVYEVWTDVNGIYTVDPNVSSNVSSNAQLIKNIDYELVQELSAMGAKVMHPLSIQPCAEKNISIIVKNTFNQESLFGDINTTITSTINTTDIFIATQKSQTVFDIKSPDMWNAYGFVYDIFRRFSEKQVDVNIITTSQFSVSTTTNDTNIYKLYSLRDNLKEKYEINMYSNCVILSVISHDIKKILNLIDYEFLKDELLIIHVGNNNKTINFVLKNFKNSYIEKLYSMIITN